MEWMLPRHERVERVPEDALGREEVLDDAVVLLRVVPDPALSKRDDGLADLRYGKRSIGRIVHLADHIRGGLRQDEALDGGRQEVRPAAAFHRRRVLLGL